MARTLGDPLIPFLTWIEETSLLVRPVTPRLPGAMVDRRVGVEGLDRSTTWTPVLEEAKARFESGSYAGISAPARATLPLTLPVSAPVGLMDKALPVTVTADALEDAVTVPSAAYRPNNAVIAVLTDRFIEIRRQ
jgi:hypothetical protein